MLKRMLALLTALALLLGCAAAETAVETEPAAKQEEVVHQIEAKLFPCYLFSNESPLWEEFPLYFQDGVYDLPFVDLNDWAAVLNTFYPAVSKELFAGYQVSVEVNEAASQVRFTRENGFNAYFEFNDGRIIWDDYMGFLQQTVGAYMDITSLPPTDSEGRPFLLSRINGRDRHGDFTILNLADYGIPMIALDGKYLVPLQTLAAFFITPYQAGCFFNQQNLIITMIAEMVDPQREFMMALMTNGVLTEEFLDEMQAQEGDDDAKMEYLLRHVMQSETGVKLFLEFQDRMSQSLHPLYTAGPKGERSDALTQYGYQELCLEMDSFYGLRDAHNISDFQTFFYQTGLTLSLLHPDAGIADSAIAEMVQYWLDDGHSGFIGASYLTSIDPDENTATGFDYLTRDQLGKAAQTARNMHPEARQAYYEVGDTAYVTFDEFMIDTEDSGQVKDYYALIESGELPEDTIGLIIQAHRQITRENSPIRNVVLDLSCNGGGAAPAAVFVMGWFLGNAQISMQNPFTGSENTTVYRADVNLDHQLDDKDTVSHLNLYCLISPSSFSCGNLLPWAFKADGRVTLLGKVSGGGSCVVQHMTTAWGTVFQISGIKRISFTKNGAYYDVDRGVEPDYIIHSYDHFYDREALTEYIHSLF